MNKNKNRFKNVSKEFLNSKEYHVREETSLLPFLLSIVSGQSRNAIKGMLSHHLVAVNGSPTRLTRSLRDTRTDALST